MRTYEPDNNDSGGNDPTDGVVGDSASLTLDTMACAACGEEFQPSDSITVLGETRVLSSRGFRNGDDRRVWVSVNTDELDVFHSHCIETRQTVDSGGVFTYTSSTGTIHQMVRREVSRHGDAVVRFQSRCSAVQTVTEDDVTHHEDAMVYDGVEPGEGEQLCKRCQRYDPVGR